VRVFLSDTDISFWTLFTITEQNRKERDHLLRLGVDGRIIPKSFLKKLIHLVYNRGHWRALIDTVMNLWKVLQEWLVSAVPRDKNVPSCLRVNKPYVGRHSCLKASIIRFNFVSTAECECGDGLQTEEHIFWDCKLYEEQGQQWWSFCLRTAKQNTQTQLQSS
jgi:hypothetical protein